MNKRLHLLPFVNLILTSVGLNLFLYQPRWTYYLSAFTFLFVAWSIFLMAKKGKAVDGWLNYIILPITGLAGVVFYGIMSQNKVVAGLIFLFFAVFLYFYLRAIYYYLINQKAYRPYSIQNISAYGCFLVMWLWAASIYGLADFLDLAPSYLGIFIFIGSALLSYQFFWAHKANIIKAWPHIVVLSLVILEIGWVMFYLPFNFNVAGLILALLFYGATGLSRYYMEEAIDWKKIKTYLSIMIAAVVLILVTARWL